MSTRKLEEIVFDTETGVYHLGSRSAHLPKDGGYLDSYETHCGETYERWRRPRKVRVGPLNLRSALPWEENHYVPRTTMYPTSTERPSTCTYVRRVPPLK